MIYEYYSQYIKLLLYQKIYIKAGWFSESTAKGYIQSALNNYKQTQNPYYTQMTGKSVPLYNFEAHPAPSLPGTHSLQIQSIPHQHLNQIILILTLIKNSDSIYSYLGYNQNGVFFRKLCYNGKFSSTPEILEI